MNVLVSGAGGKTGQAITAVLRELGLQVRPWRRGARDAVEDPTSYQGDMTLVEAWAQAMTGVDKVYHICPNMHSDEVAIGKLAVSAAKKGGVSHFVYHSVLHPHIQTMPHHWHKLQVEEMVLESGLPFTILQPTAYMQNIRAQWPAILAGVFPVPYPIKTALALVDLADVAAAAGTVLSGDRHLGAVYELVGTPPLSQAEVARRLTEVVGRRVTAVETPLPAWKEQAQAAGLAPFVMDTLLKMFAHYAQHGLVGNSFVLESLLQRPPTDLKECARRWLQVGE